MRYKTEKKIFDSDSPINQIIEKMMNHSIKIKKSTLTNFNYEGHLEQFLNLGIIIKYDDQNYSFSEDSFLIGFFLIKDAEKKLKRKLPSDIKELFKFISDYDELLKYPRQNDFWCSSLIGILIKTCLIGVHESGQNLEKFLEDLRKNRKEYKSISFYFAKMERFFFQILTSLNLKPEKIYDLALIYSTYENGVFRKNVYDALKKIGNVDVSIAISTYEITKNLDNRKYDYYVPALLSGIYELDANYAYKESLKLFEINPPLGLYAFINLDFKSSDEINSVVKIVEKDATKIEISELPKFYSFIIKKNEATQNQKRYCISKLVDFRNSENQNVINQLVFGISSIKGFDKEKIQVLETMLNRELFPDLTHYFMFVEDIAPVFKLMKKQVKSDRFKYDYYKNAINNFATKDHRSFNEETLELLSSKDLDLRLLGWQVVNGKYYGMHKLNFDNISDEKKIIAMNVLMSHPIEIGDLMSQVGVFMKSMNIDVLKSFKKNCNKLLSGFGNNFLMAFKNSVDMSHKASKIFLTELELEYNLYSQLLEKKSKIIEFDPFKNHFHLSELYYKVVKEREQEIFDRENNKDGFFTEMATTIPVVRGNGFKSETNPTITKLQDFSYSKQLNKNHFLNPLESGEI